MTKSITLKNGLIADKVDYKYLPDPATPNYHFVFVKVTDSDICSADTTGEFAGGEGTIASPKLICTISDLYDIFPSTASAPLYTSYANFNYKLLSDLDLTNEPVRGDASFTKLWANCVANGSNFMPIGVTWNGSVCTTVDVSQVVFDGGSHTIKGIKLIRPLGEDASLYWNLRDSTIQRITLDNLIATGSAGAGAVASASYKSFFRRVNLLNPIINSTGDLSGGLVGYSEGSDFVDINIQNLTFSGNSEVGGIIGKGITWLLTTKPTTISRSFVSGSVSGLGEVGGLAGTLGDMSLLSIVSESRFSGTVSNTDSNLGGLVGRSFSLRIINSYVNATLSNTSLTAPVNMGGITGSMNDYTTSAGIFSSYVTASLSFPCTSGASCSIDSVVGDYTPGFSPTDFDTAVYSDSNILTSFSSIDVGYDQPDLSFFRLSPGWTNVGGDIMPSFPSSIWEFRAGSTPKLQVEP